MEKVPYFHGNLHYEIRARLFLIDKNDLTFYGFFVKTCKIRHHKLKTSNKMVTF